MWSRFNHLLQMDQFGWFDTSCSIEQKSLKQGVKVALKTIKVITEGRK